MRPNSQAGAFPECRGKLAVPVLIEYLFAFPAGISFKVNTTDYPKEVKDCSRLVVNY
jgi:hypothetical protein